MFQLFHQEIKQGREKYDNHQVAVKPEGIVCGQGAVYGRTDAAGIPKRPKPVAPVIFAHRFVSAGHQIGHKCLCAKMKPNYHQVPNQIWKQDGTGTLLDFTPIDLAGKAFCLEKEQEARKEEKQRDRNARKDLRKEIACGLINRKHSI